MRRRYVVVAAALLVSAPPLAWAGLRGDWLWSGPGTSEHLTSQENSPQNDMAAVQTFLARMRGTNAFACELALINIDHRNWFGGLSNQISDSPFVDDSMALALPEELQTQAVIEPLMAGLRDSDACVRRTAASLLGRTPRASERLRGALDDSSPDMRALAAFALGLAEDSAAAPRLLSLLRDASPIVRATAVAALGELEYKPGIPAIAERLERDTSASVRRAAARALGRIAG